MCLTLKYLLVLSVALNIGLLISNILLIRNYKRNDKLKTEKEIAEGWKIYWEVRAKDLEQKYNSLKDRRRGE